MPYSDRLRVLLLEDEPLIAMELKALVEEEGYVVVGPARTCTQAMAMLKMERVGAALIDAIVGDERCDAVADELDAQRIPWALVSGFDAGELGERFSGVPILSKPYHPTQLSQVLRQLVEGEA